MMVNKCLFFKSYKKLMVVLEGNVSQIYPSINDANVSHITLKNGCYFRAENVQELFIDLNGLNSEAVTMMSSEDHIG